MLYLKSFSLNGIKKDFLIYEINQTEIGMY